MDDFFAYAARGTKTLYRDKPLLPDQLYHVFNRRDDGADVFRDDEDKEVFENAVKRFIRPDLYTDGRGRRATERENDVTLLAYCVLDTHYHLVLRQLTAMAMSKFMQSVMSSYAQRFNRKYERSGPLFDGPYQARPILSTRHLKKAIAYTHANPESPHGYRWSGHRFYEDEQLDSDTSWFDATAGLRVYGSLDEYRVWFEREVEERARRRKRKGR